MSFFSKFFRPNTMKKTFRIPGKNFEIAKSIYLNSERSVGCNTLEQLEKIIGIQKPTRK